MKIVVLSENTTRGPKVSPEFGLSLHITCGSASVLFDSGCSRNFAQNAETLGIDLSRVDCAVLSHGHFDHSNGFGAFININDHAPIYAHRSFDGEYYKQPDEYIGVEPSLKASNRFKAVDGILDIGEGLTLLSYDEASVIHPIESEGMFVKDGNATRPDDFTHEHYLLACEGDVRLLVTGCSHRGIANIMNWVKDLRVTHVIGGFHLMGIQPGDYSKLDALAEELAAYDVMYFTGHCTGIEQYAYLKSLMGDRVSYAGAGQIITL
ncbi:MAG: MBL fold metallo-hydrolase [Eggerthellaceae bacterium]|nr:MBL fold metallo-hydrolase [Eggerthellaceae bacterium]